jgi:hypothetical protein
LETIKEDQSSQDSKNKERKETKMSNENTFTYTKRTSNVELKKTQYSINDTCKILQLSSVWVRRMIKQGKLVAKKVDGKWMISRESIYEKLDFLGEKDERLERRIRGESTHTYQVPSLKSCDIIERRVKEDKSLTKEQRELFTKRIDSYRTYFTKRLDKIRKERK